MLPETWNPNGPLIGKGRPSSLGRLKQPLKREDKIDQDSFQDVSRYKRVCIPYHI